MNAIRLEAIAGCDRLPLDTTAQAAFLDPGGSCHRDGASSEVRTSCHPAFP